MTVSLRAFSLPLARPLETAAGTIERREGTLVRVATDDAAGIGEATPLPGWTEPPDTCRDALDDAAAAYDDDGRAAALAALDGTPAARHGFALALADLDATAAGRPLYRHLGGDDPVDSVPANATIGDGTAAETAAAARDAVDEGFGCLKVKVGARAVGADLERLAAVREAVGAGVDLRADANGAWSRDEAARAVDGLADRDVAYVEQPLPADDLDGHADLRGRGVGIALDETLASVPAERAIDADAADVLILKPMVLGGVDRAREVATAARAAGLSAVVSTTVDAVVARTAAVHLAASLPERPPAGVATAGRLADDLGPDPAPVRGGAARVPGDKGLGARGVWEA